MEYAEPIDVRERRLAGEWLYSRTWRMHWIDDGRRYNTKNCKGGQDNLWCIEVNVEYGKIHKREDGYNLYHKGKFVKHAKTVKELKELVTKKQK